jgi:hypothetical protein
MMAMEDKVFCAQRMVEKEVTRAISLYPPHNSAHEAYAVLLEEMDELWDEVKKSPKKRDKDAMLEESVQVAAMAVRFIIDVCMVNKEG